MQLDKCNQYIRRGEDGDNDGDDDDDDGDGEGGNEAERLVSGGSGYLRAGVAEG